MSVKKQEKMRNPTTVTIDPPQIPIWVEAKPGGGLVPYGIYFVHTKDGKEYYFQSDMGNLFEKIRTAILDALEKGKGVTIISTLDQFKDQESIAESSTMPNAKPPFRSEPFRYYLITDVA